MLPPEERLSRPKAGLSLMNTPDFAAAAKSLFEAGMVDALEWSFEIGWSKSNPLPSWTEGLLYFFSSEGALYGHGVSGSLLSAGWTPRQKKWLQQISLDVQRWPCRGVSEHFGWMTARGWQAGPPLPPPMIDATLQAGRRGLRRLREMTDTQVGLENLALAMSQRDVWDQGPFLEALLSDVDGYLVLDLHNLWCQVVNYGVNFMELLDTYPTRRVRVIHVSGGSWASVTGGRWRRDTHDGEVPAPVMALLPLALQRCRRTEVVILERLGGTIRTQGQAQRFQKDYSVIWEMVNG